MVTQISCIFIPQFKKINGKYTFNKYQTSFTITVYADISKTTDLVLEINLINHQSPLRWALTDS